MIDYEAYQMAVRNRALTLAVCTTGAVALSVTPAGYARTAGDFTADKLAVGMEILASGFAKAANNGYAVITALTPTLCSVTAYDVVANVVIPRALIAEAGGTPQTLTVGIPSLRAWENTAFKPTTGIPFTEEQFMPGPTSQITLGPNGLIECLPQYALKINTPEDTGPLANGRYAAALINLFTLRTSMVLASGDVLRVRSDAGPFVGQRLPSRPGFSVVPVTFPLRIRTQNSI